MPRLPARTALMLALALSLPALAQTPPQVAVPQTAVPTAPAAAPSARAAGGDGEVRVANQGGRHVLNLKGADINALIETVAQITGRSFIVDPRVEGRVTVISERPMDADEVMATFESVLRVHGYALVRSGELIKIVPDAIASREAGLVSSGPDGVLTRLIPVRHVGAQELANLLRPMLAPEAQLVAHPDSNTLVLSDRASAAERLAQVVARIDTAADSEVEVIALRHASASELQRTLSMLAQPGAAGAPSLKLAADTRTNSLLLSGPKAERLRLRAMVAHLDTPLSTGDSTQVIYLRYANAADLVPILEGVAATLTGVAPSKDGAAPAHVIAHQDTNALVISAAPAVYRELQAVVRQLDIRRAQVLVEAVIAEVSDDLADELGVQWQSTNYDGTGSGYFGGTNYNGSTGNAGIVGSLTNPLGAVSGNGLNLGYIGGRIDLPIGPDGENVTVFQVGALVKALRGDGRANVLSQPSIVTLDHQKAEIKVVQEVPFVTGQYTNTSNGGTSSINNPFQTIEREDVGLILVVTPHVNEGDSVRLDIRQEVSALAAGVSGAVDLVTNKRELTTSVLVPDQGMLVLGGLTSDEVRQNVQGVPGVSRVPLLGNLFKSRSASKARRQLMVFLRPTILRDAALEAAVSGEKYNYLRAEQLRMREHGEMRFRGVQQPVLPELEPRVVRPADTDAAGHD